MVRFSQSGAYFCQFNRQTVNNDRLVKMSLTKRVFVFTVMAGLALITTGRVAAQTLTPVHSFGGFPDGSYPIAGVILSGNTLYGTTADGGNPGAGTVYAINTDGTGYTILHNFAGGSDGSGPSFGGLLLVGNTLYGTASGGGSTGTVFKVNIDGTGFTNLVTFTNTNPGAEPTGGLVMANGTLYGTTFRGGSANAGQIFAVNPDGSGFVDLFDFTDDTPGFNPYAGLVYSDGRLYGTTDSGGEQSPSGTVFAVNTNGTGFTSLHTFSTPVYNSTLNVSTNIDGATLYAGVILSGGTLYGVSYLGGLYGNGTVFSVSTNGTGFTALYEFSAVGQTALTNSDGQNPVGTLTISGNTLYGTTIHGGPAGYGTAFKVNTDGTGFVTLHGFSGIQGANRDGNNPFGGLILSGNILYGTAENNGTSGMGTVFRLSLTTIAPPPMAIALSGGNVVLSWASTDTGFALQSSAGLASQAFWSPVSPAPVVVNGQNVVTNAASGTQSFYRLIQ
jgi:uncharacterized repeat protein (TIGR03803 family)